MPDIPFTARVVKGVGRGKTIGSPTLNLSLEDVPASLEHGIYACIVTLGMKTERLQAVMHFGPRPVFNDSLSCEVFVLDCDIPHPPQTVTVHLTEFIREIIDVPVREVLQDQIKADIRVARAILEEHL